MTTFGIPPENPTDYTGPKKALTPQIKAPRAPATTDKQHPIGTRWWDTATNDWYWLANFESNGNATWKKLTATSSSSPLTTLTTDDATVVTPVSNNIDVAGNASQGVSTSGSGDTVTITVANATTSTKGVASFNSADFTVTAGAVSLAGGSAADTFTTDSGNAAPSGGVLNILGGTDLDTTGSGSTVTVNITAPISVANGGTGLTTITDGGIMLGSGTGAITPTAQPTNGQLLIGSTGVDPVLAVLTDGEGIDTTIGAGSITVACELATAAATVGAANIGAAAFDSADFTVTSGFVSLNSPSAVPPDYESIPTFVDDFLQFKSSTTTNDNSDYSISSSSTTIITDEVDHIGIQQMPGSVAWRTVYLSSRKGNAGNVTNIIVGGGEITLTLWQRFSVAPTQGSMFFGLNNAYDYATATDSIGFYVADYSSSTDIVAYTTASSTSTTTSTGVAGDHTSFKKYQIVINDDASEVKFYIDGTLKATHTSPANIPTSTNLAYLVGTANVNITTEYQQLDFIEFRKQFTGDRA